MLQQFAAILRHEAALEHELANELAAAITRGLTKHHGGRDLYVPTYSGFERRETIRRDFNGRNRDELMARWDVSRSTIYRVIAASPEK